MAEETGTTNLDKIDHIVVLMLENRSFDHMLGYLSLEGARNDIDGLRPSFSNEHDGHSYPVHHLDCTAIPDDPDHSASAVDLQIGDGAMDGFAASYARTLTSRGIQDGDPGRVLGYYNAADVPVYDHLARQFAVCDHWFSSVPAATWPNRLYAICGRAARSRDDLPRNMPPLYNQPSFVRHLGAHGITWRWYSLPHRIQPNDDHAPADIKDGQELVLAVYHALAAGPQWEKTLLIIFYDEHGGFFDHVTPPAAPDDDPENFGRYGVRVPALIVSPWIEPGSISSTTFDHTSIVKTILQRFCPDALIEPKPHHGLFARATAISRPHYLGTRVAQAHDLGELLTRTAPRPAPDRVLLIEGTASRAARSQDPSPGPDDPGGKPVTDLQLRIAAAVRELRRRGHPADRP